MGASQSVGLLFDPTSPPRRLGIAHVAYFVDAARNRHVVLVGEAHAQVVARVNERGLPRDTRKTAEDGGDASDHILATIMRSFMTNSSLTEFHALLEDPRHNFFAPEEEQDDDGNGNGDGDAALHGGGGLDDDDDDDAPFNPVVRLGHDVGVAAEEEDDVNVSHRLDHVIGRLLDIQERLEERGRSDKRVVVDGWDARPRLGLANTVIMQHWVFSLQRHCADLALPTPNLRVLVGSLALMGAEPFPTALYARWKQLDATDARAWREDSEPWIRMLGAQVPRFVRAARDAQKRGVYTNNTMAHALMRMEVAAAHAPPSTRALDWVRDVLGSSFADVETLRALTARSAGDLDTLVRIGRAERNTVMMVMGGASHTAFMHLALEHPTSPFQLVAMGAMVDPSACLFPSLSTVALRRRVRERMPSDAPLPCHPVDWMAHPDADTNPTIMLSDAERALLATH